MVAKSFPGSFSALGTDRKDRKNGLPSSSSSAVFTEDTKNIFEENFVSRRVKRFTLSFALRSTSQFSQYTVNTKIHHIFPGCAGEADHSNDVKK